MNISASIKAKRLECGLTQKELADKVGVDQSMICQIERGTKSPTLALSVEIAARWAVTCASLQKISRNVCGRTIDKRALPMAVSSADGSKFV